jgi:hypothetical protein
MNTGGKICPKAKKVKVYLEECRNAFDKCIYPICSKAMIRSFQHKGLKKLFEEDDRSKVNAQDADKLARILARLNRSVVPQDMAAPGFRLHPRKGSAKAFGPSP